MSADSGGVFRIEEVRTGAMAIMALSGELDIAGQARLMAEVDRVLARRTLIVAMDLRGLTFMDASGVHAMVRAGRACQARGQRFFLIRGPAQIDRLLAAVGLDGYFDMVSEPDHLPDGSLTVASGL